MKTYYYFPFLLLLLSVGCGDDDQNLPPSELDTVVLNCPNNPNESHSLGARLQEVIDRYQAMGYPSISALVATPEGIWQGTAGDAAVQLQQPANYCHLYHSGSVAKLYTVVAALQQVEAGLLDLDAGIDQYLPTLITDNLPNGHSATVRQLMNHSSGIPDHDDEEELSIYVDNNYGHLPEPETQLAYLYDNEPWFAAGTAARYSSANTLVLAIILDGLDEGSHADMISQGIIEPLGLSDTYYKNEMAYPNPPFLVNTYGLNLDGLPFYNLSSAAQNYALGSHGDAGVIATTLDFYHFLRAIIEAEIIETTTRNSMMETETILDDGTFSFEAGLGLLVFKNGSVQRIGHSGGTVGGASNLYYYPDQESYIVLLTNYSPETDVELTNKFYGSGVIGSRADLLGELESIALEN